MKTTFLFLSIILYSISTQAQSYFPARNVETNLEYFSKIDGQWIAVGPANNTLGGYVYQGINFGYDTNNYVSLANGAGTNDLYFGRWDYEWKGWNKIWHSGNLNNIDTDFTAKTINTSKINVNIAGGRETIDAFTIDVGTFSTDENAARSTFFRVRDIGATHGIPFIIKGNGYVGIGTSNPTSLLTVAGNIGAREVKVTVDAGADFVFENDYNLPSLESVDQFIKENKHLPEIASAKEMQKNGINLSEMNIKLLQKMEEMTLYMIEQNKKIKELQNENKNFKVVLEKLSKVKN